VVLRNPRSSLISSSPKELPAVLVSSHSKGFFAHSDFSYQLGYDNTLPSWTRVSTPIGTGLITEIHRKLGENLRETIPKLVKPIAGAESAALKRPR
jgi:hypothetical protein